MKWLNLFIILIVAVSELVFSKSLNQSFVGFLYFSIKYVIILFLVFVSTPPNFKKNNFDITSWVIFFLSFIFLIGMNQNRSDQSMVITLVSLSNYFFYASLVIYSYISLGKSIGLVPEARQIKQLKAYSISRHPIYFFSSLLILNFAISNFSVKNITIAVISILLTSLRGFREEKFLSEVSDYQDYKLKVKVLPLKSATFILPVLILSFFKYQSINKNQDFIKTLHFDTDVGFYSLNPTEYDDWTSALLANHLLVRLVEDNSRHGDVNSICKLVSNNCLADSEACKRRRIKFDCSNIKGCNDELFTIDELKNELEIILSRKNWLLPNYNFCSSGSSLCVEFDNHSNIDERLQSIYFRFGWSKLSKYKNIGAKSIFGFGTHCIDPNSLVLESKVFKLSSRSQLPNVFLTVSSDFDADVRFSETKNKKEHYKEFKLNSPISYYSVSNHSQNEKRYVWESDQSIKIIQKFLRDNQLIFKERPPFSLHSKDVSNAMKLTDLYFTGAAVYWLPAFIQNCSDLADRLNNEWVKKLGMKTKAVCRDLNTTIQDVVLKNHNWHGFLSPLTPGAPYATSIPDQYFNRHSNDSWISRDDNYEIFSLIGFGMTSIFGKKDFVCSIRESYLGLSDLHITDIRMCEK